MQVEVSFYVKTCDLETLNIFIDDSPVYGEKDRYIWHGSNGTHKIRIEQVKMFRSKWFWIVAPLIFIIFEGDAVDGRTPFYAVYEAEIDIETNITVNVNLVDINSYLDRSKQGFKYRLEVYFPQGTDFKLMKNEFTATQK